MSVLDHARLIIYRVNQKGLEIFLLKPEAPKGEKWRIPETVLKNKRGPNVMMDQDIVIHLDPVENEDGNMQNAVALEADWHEIPSVRAIIKEDVKIVKTTIKEHIPDLEQGTYVAVKECFKKMMPHEYKMIKELKDILIDRNQSKYI